jgi:glutathione S-transferase
VAGQHYGLTKEASFLEMNPNGRVPVINDDGFILYESNAIIRYLWAKTFPSESGFKNLQSWSSADRWMEWTSATLYYPLFREFYIYFARTPAAELNPIKADQLLNAVYPLLKIANDQLGQTSYIAGNAFSMADIPLGVLIDKWEKIDQQKSNLLNLSIYYDRLLKREHFCKHVTQYALNAI